MRIYNPPPCTLSQRSGSAVRRSAVTFGRLSLPFIRPQGWFLLSCHILLLEGEMDGTPGAYREGKQALRVGP